MLMPFDGAALLRAPYAAVDGDAASGHRYASRDNGYTLLAARRRVIIISLPLRYVDIEYRGRAGIYCFDATMPPLTPFSLLAALPLSPIRAADY